MLWRTSKPIHVIKTFEAIILTFSFLKSNYSMNSNNCDRPGGGGGKSNLKKLYFYEEDASSRHTDALCLCVWITLRESNVVVAGNYSIRCDTWQTFTLETMEKRRHDIKILFSGGQGHFAEYWNHWKNKQMMQLSSRLTRQCAIYSILHEYNPTRTLLKTYPDRHQELCFYLCPTNVWNTNVQCVQNVQ